MFTISYIYLMFFFDLQLQLVYAFQSAILLSTRRTSRTPCFAKKEKGGSSGKGFGPPPEKKEPKYTISDKSYDTSSATDNVKELSSEEIQASMTEFFGTYDNWKPLFHNVLQSESLATSFLSDVVPQELWGISTLEQRNPWRLLPAKPTNESSLAVIGTFLDELQRSLLDIPLDSIISGENDLHFLEEGRRTIAVTRFHVLEEYYKKDNDDWESELFRAAWSEMAHLMSQDEVDTGSLVLLPDHLAGGGGDDEKGLEYVKEFVERKLIQPINWLGRESDWEIVALERGSVAVRLLYKLSDIPDLSERDSGSDGKLL